MSVDVCAWPSHSRLPFVVSSEGRDLLCDGDLGQVEKTFDSENAPLLSNNVKVHCWEGRNLD